jgi:manganese transport protein
VILNLKLVYETAATWIADTDSALVKGLIIAGELGLLVLLVITIVYPLIFRQREASIDIHKDISMDALYTTVSKPFAKVALALDYSEKDQRVIQYAMQLGNMNTEYVLIHIVESAQARVLEDEAEDYETLKDKEHLHEYVKFMQAKNYKATGVLGFKKRTKEIARIVKENNCDLLVLGSHGHKTVKDFIFGETINTLRHLVEIPVFIAK